MPSLSRSRPLSAVTLIAALAVATALAGCSAIPGIGSQQREQVYASWSDAPRGEDELLAPPAFVPEDAAELRVRVITSGPGEIVRWTGGSPVTGENCAAGPLVGAPLLQSTWWPAEIPREGMVCDAGWQVFQKDGYTYAWTSV